VTIDLWERSAWERFLRTRLGRLVWDSPCTRATTEELPDGHAVIYAGHAQAVALPGAIPRGQADARAGDQPDRSIRAEPSDGYGVRCPDLPFDRYLAHVYLGDVVASVNLPYCFACARRPTAAADPYNSREGMEALVRGLRSRAAGN
jgi:hypothetical protein